MNKIETPCLLNVLCLKYDLYDAELLKENLIDSDYLVTMDIANSQQEFADFLNCYCYDIVIVGGALPQFDELAALKMTLSLRPEIPFICVSGTIDEEKAIELLKHGASDCVINCSPERLFFAVKRVLKEKESEKERKQNEKLLKESEERFHLLFDKAPLGYQSLDIDGNFIEVNQQWLETLGYTKDEVIGRWFGDFLAPEFINSFRERFPIFIEEGKIHSEFEMLHKNGSKLVIAFVGRIGYDANKDFKQTHCILQDITDVKKVQEEIIRQKELLQEVIDHLPVMITYFDNNGKILMTNNELERVLGWTSEEWKTENILAKCYPKPEDLHELQTFLSFGNIGWKDFKTCTKYGTILDTSWTNVKLSEGISMGIGQDITNRKKEEESLKKSQLLLKSSIESQQETIIFSIDTNYNYLIFNKALSDAMKRAWEIDIQLGKSILDCIPTVDERLLAKSNYDRALNGESFSIIQKYGDVHPAYYESFFNPIRNDKNEIIGCTGLARNITQRMVDEEELRNSYIFSETLLKTIPFGMDIVDETGTVLFQSENFKELFGEDAIGEKCWELYRDDKKQCGDCPLHKGIIVGETATYESHGVTGGRIFDISHTGMLYKGKKAMLEIFRDITERKAAEEELKSAKEKAEESDRLKSAFLSNMSHEIRTPMNGILGFAGLLKEPTLTVEEQQDFIKTIGISGERMLSTINSIVDISKIEAGMVNVVIRETNINDKMLFTHKFFKPEVESKGLKFLYKYSLPTNEAIINTDNEKVYAILTNLVKNAIKFTHSGSIEFGYDKKGEYLEFYVKDTGSGIPENKKELVFERFRQGSESHYRGYDGSGLGLSICKSYVEMLGGRLWVESEEGMGSTFYFTIPYNPVSEETALEDFDSQDHGDVQIQDLKILIVEDDEISYSLLSRVVQKISKEVLHAVTGVEAVQACRDNPDLNLVLMDIRMPRMSGLEATQQIRQFNKDVIIIAQTAHGFSSDCENAINAGCNDYITKPIDKALLYELIKKYCYM